MSERVERHFKHNSDRTHIALVLGRAGLDLYPQPDGEKIENTHSFSSDLGGSAANIAVAIAQAGKKVGLISALSDDAVGAFARNRLKEYGVDLSWTITTHDDSRTSLALAEVRSDDCDVVIYRNNPADLQVRFTPEIKAAVKQTQNLIVTGTSLIEPSSQDAVLATMRAAREAGCNNWLDLDYRSWNWPNMETTRATYGRAAELSDILVGNEEEFAVLSDDFTQLCSCSRDRQQLVLLKKGASGAVLFSGHDTLETGIYPVTVKKPYGAGDAFLGNLLATYVTTGSWQDAMEIGSAAAALVVSRRGCASAMPTPEQVADFQKLNTITPNTKWI